ncbi:hypothetical protein ACWKT5_11570 [Streptomyces avermitilis]
MTSPVSAMVVTSRDWSSPRRAQARAAPYPLPQVTSRREVSVIHAARYIISQGGQRGGRGGTARSHPAEENSYQYGLIDAHLTTAVDDLLSITRAEAEAHMGMGKRYRPIASEAFRAGDITVVSLWADVAVLLHQPQEDED